MVFTEQSTKTWNGHMQIGFFSRGHEIFTGGFGILTRGHEILMCGHEIAKSFPQDD
jgi:hypothetical protein